MRNILLILFISIIILSCKKENNYENNDELCAILSEMNESDQQIRNLKELKNGSQKIKDSLWEIQNHIDHENTELLIEIIKKRGWISHSELGCSEYIAPVVIFRHAPKKYWNEIQSLIDKEYAEKRIGKGDFWFIDNHLKDRHMNFENGGIKIITE